MADSTISVVHTVNTLDDIGPEYNFTVKVGFSQIILLLLEVVFSIKSSFDVKGVNGDPSCQPAILVYRSTNHQQRRK